MSIFALKKSDVADMQDLLKSITIFTQDEVDVVNELLEIYLYTERQKDYFFFGTRDEHKLTSFICFGPTPMTANTFDLYWIGTHPETRGQGLAYRLIEFMKVYMRERNAKLIRVETASKELYADTQKFYDRLNFKEAARIQDFYSDGDDLITYIMNIKA